jgi:hypothetical protein
MGFSIYHVLKTTLLPFLDNTISLIKIGGESMKTALKKILLCTTGNVLFDLLTARLHVRR